jgi:hypothetical protein
MALQSEAQEWTQMRSGRRGESGGGQMCCAGGDSIAKALTRMTEALAIEAEAGCSTTIALAVAEG